LEKKIKTSRCLFTEEQVSSHLKVGDFRKAIDLCKEVYKKYPQDATIRDGYIRTLESVKTNGDRAFEGRDFARAGSVYETVLRNLSFVSHLNGSLSFSKEGLTAKINNCRKVLFEKGLKQYRSGNLNQAILLWKSILIFDPDNREIKKAVDMATLQVENLQNTK
jgi:tetratricopeptide (TPR) repeat protein